MQVNSTKQFWRQENRNPYGCSVLVRPKKERRRENPICVCTSYEKTLNLGFAYILEITWSSRHKGGWGTPIADRFWVQGRDPEPSSVSM